VAQDGQRNYVRSGIRGSSRFFGTFVERVIRLAFGVRRLAF
jgi:hypothetical protein